MITRASLRPVTACGQLGRFGLAGLCLMPGSAWACATCFGNSDEAMARGMTMGILALLVVVTFVLGGLAAFGIFLARRAARYNLDPGSVPSAAEAQPIALAPALSQPTK